jgi:hypothetical protein
MDKKVFIYSIPIKKETGISDWVNPTSGVKLNRTKIKKCTTKIVAAYSPKLGGLKNYISYNPWLDEVTGQQKKDNNGKLLTLQDKLEEMFNKPRGHFTNTPWPKQVSGISYQPTYFQLKTWALNDGATMLDLGKMDDLLGYYVALDSNYVANSESEWRGNKWPKATHYIALENESEMIKYQRTNFKSNAFAKLHDKALTPTYQRKIAVILNLINAVHKPTNEHLHNLYYNLIDLATERTRKDVQRFIELVDNIATKDGRIKLEALYLLQCGLDTRTIVNRKGTYTWIRPEGSIDIGYRLEDALDYLLDPKKDKELIELNDSVMKLIPA